MLIMILLSLSLGIIWVSHTDLAPLAAFKALSKSQELYMDTYNSTTAKKYVLFSHCLTTIDSLIVILSRSKLISVTQSYW